MPINNIVLIIVNALRKSNLGCYSYPFGTSPNIDKLANQSLVFGNARAVSNKTDPCFTSIITGLYPAQHGITHHANEIKDNELTNIDKFVFIQELMKTKGYRTYGFDFLGRWHKRGYNYYMGLDKKRRMRFIETFRKMFNIKPGSLLQRLLERTPLYNFFLRLLFSHQSPPYKPADELVDTVLKTFIPGKNYSMLHFWDTHIPYWPPKRYIKPADYSNYFSNTDLQLSEIRKNIHAPLRRFFFDCMMNQYTTVNDVLQAYDGEIRFVDDNIGRLIKNFDMSKTLMIITADHGESLVEDSIYFTHDGFADCVMDIPLIMWYPGCKHKRIDKKVDSTHIFNMIMTGGKKW